MLDSNIQAQLKAYLQRLQQPIELVASLDDRPASAEMRELLEEIAALSDKVSARFDGVDARRPSFQITRAGAQVLREELARDPQLQVFEQLLARYALSA